VINRLLLTLIYGNDVLQPISVGYRRVILLNGFD